MSPLSLLDNDLFCFRFISVGGGGGGSWSAYWTSPGWVNTDCQTGSW